MKARTKAVVGGVITCGVSFAISVKAPHLIKTAESILRGETTGKLTEYTILTCQWWWIVPVTMLAALLAMGRGRDPDETFFKGYYAAFTVVMAVMMMVLIGGLMMPMMGMSMESIGR